MDNCKEKYNRKYSTQQLPPPHPGDGINQPGEAALYFENREELSYLEEISAVFLPVFSTFYEILVFLIHKLFCKVFSIYIIIFKKPLTFYVVCANFSKIPHGCCTKTGENRGMARISTVGK